MSAGQEGARARRRGPVDLLAYGPDGRIHSTRLLGVVALAIVFVALGTFVAMLAASVGEPEVLGFWVVVTFLAIKIPLLTVLWTLLRRHAGPAGQDDWSASETREILHYIEREAAASRGRRDAGRRLRYFREEAWAVAGRAEPDLREAAEAVARRIDAMAEATPDASPPAT